MKEYKAAFRAAFPHTIPMLTSFLLIGLAYGIYAKSMGLPFWFPAVASIVIYAGSMEFVMVNLLTGSFDPLSAFLMALMVNARHFFYGLSMLERFKGIGKKKFHLIYFMSDETYSVNCSAKPPGGVDEVKFMQAVTILNQSYWIFGASFGGLLGAAFTFDSRGIDFILIALYVTIFLNQWMDSQTHAPALTGLFCSVGMLIILGAENFVLPAMILIMVILLLLRKNIGNDKKDVHVG